MANSIHFFACHLDELSFGQSLDKFLVKFAPLKFINLGYLNVLKS